MASAKQSLRRNNKLRWDRWDTPYKVVKQLLLARANTWDQVGQGGTGGEGLIPFLVGPINFCGTESQPDKGFIIASFGSSSHCPTCPTKNTFLPT